MGISSVEISYIDFVPLVRIFSFLSGLFLMWRACLRPALGVSRILLVGDFSCAESESSPVFRCRFLAFVVALFPLNSLRGFVCHVLVPHV